MFNFYNDYRQLRLVMVKNMKVNESNQSLIVESLRSIAEIVIWGDQNDPAVFDFFLEHDMVSYFDKNLLQSAGTFVDVQILQTLNILFDNIKSMTSTCTCMYLFL